MWVGVGEPELKSTTDTTHALILTLTLTLTLTSTLKMAFTLTLTGLSDDKGFRQREWQTYDGNFVPPNLSYNDVPPCLAIGPYPQSKDDVMLMKANGVTGVLNVQTDFDHERRMIDWGHMVEHYKQAELQVTRVPIEDFNGDDLVRLVKEGARAVDKMYRDAEARGQQPKIYIHCTAGMGRAPAVACVYLVWKHGFSLHDALKHCKAHRAVCAPNWHAMESALRSGKPPTREIRNAA